MTATLFGASPTIDFPDNAEDTYSMATRVIYARNGNIVFIRFWGTTNSITTSAFAAVYQTDGTQLYSQSFPGPFTAGAWNTLVLSTPQAVAAGDTRDIVIGPRDRYAATLLVFATPLVVGNLTGTAGRFVTGAALTFPTNSSTSWYAIDVGFDENPIAPATATGSGAALNATVQTSGATTVNAGVGTGTGAAPSAQAGVGVSSGVGAAAGSSNTATIRSAPTTSSAGAIGAANNAQVTTSTQANASTAVGTGTAGSATINIAVTAGSAAGAGGAPQPSIELEGDVHLYKFGPCEPWDPIWNCNISAIVGAPAVTGNAVLAASEILYQLTAQRFGLCNVKLRPCRQSCYGNFPWYEWWQYGSYPQPYWWNGTWYNLACNSCPSNSCSCVGLDETTLPGPVVEITEVKLDGVVLTKNVDYRIDDYRKLVRLNGVLWPFCQNMNLADTEVGTWSVTASYGEIVPVLGRMAVGELAVEIVKFLLCDDTCALPQGVVDVSRQGISMTIANISELFNTGFIQLRMCDLFIKTANPNHMQARAAVYDLDSPDFRAWGTS